MTRHIVGHTTTTTSHSLRARRYSLLEPVRRRRRLAGGRRRWAGGVESVERGGGDGFTRPLSPSPLNVFISSEIEHTAHRLLSTRGENERKILTDTQGREPLVSTASHTTVSFGALTITTTQQTGWGNSKNTSKYIEASPGSTAISRSSRYVEELIKLFSGPRVNTRLP